jgi:Na+-driven multidrug efflux pump
MTESPQSTGARTRRILGIAAPIVGGMVSQNILNLVDTAMVGSLGKEALAGVGIGGFASFMAVSALTGLSAAVQAVSARRVGEGRESEAASSLHSGIVMALVVGAVLSLLLVTTVP